MIKRQYFNSSKQKKIKNCVLLVSITEINLHFDNIQNTRKYIRLYLFIKHKQTSTFFCTSLLLL